MAAAAGTALLRSMATKMGMAVAPRAPSSLHRHPLFLPGLRGRRPGPTSSRHHSSSSSAPSGATPPPPTNSKELTQNKNVPGGFISVKASPFWKLALMASFASFAMFGTGCFLLFWVRSRFEALSDQVRDLRRQRSILIKALEEHQRTHIEDQDVLAKTLQVSEQVKVSDGQQALSDEVRDLRRQRSMLIKALEDYQRIHIEDQDVLAKTLQVLEQVNKVMDNKLLR